MIEIVDTHYNDEREYNTSLVTKIGMSRSVWQNLTVLNELEREKTSLIEMEDQAHRFVPQAPQVALPTRGVPGIIAAYRRTVFGGESRIGLEIGVEDFDVDPTTTGVGIYT